MFAELPHAMELLRARHIWFSYGHGSLLRDCSFALEAGDVLHIHGASGSGKTTLLRLLAMLEAPMGGELHFCGQPYAKLDPKVLRRSVAYLQQTPTMLTGSVRENLLLGFHYGPKDSAVPDNDHLRRLLRDIAMSEEDVPLSHPARALSVGQQQRVALLRLLLMSPRVLLLDEPAAPLDSDATAAMSALLARFLEQGDTGIVFASHQTFNISGGTIKAITLHRASDEEEKTE